MIIAIHHSKNSFSESWITYCKIQNIPYKIVDCYKSDIIKQLADCDALMWHFSHSSPKDVLFAKQLLYSVKASKKKIFPDFNTIWHFDDKVGQKYLLEALNVPIVPSYVFYSKKEAIEWANHTTFPKVFKLRGGAGSANVRMAKKKHNAIRLINKAFSSGFSQYAGWSNLKERFQKFKKRKTSIFDVFKGVIRLIYTTDFAKVAGKERGYVYFQDFIPNNDYDIRVIIINEKAFAIKRMVRKNDFRASGSGNIKYEKENFDDKTIKLSFEVASKLKSQCLALDYVYFENKPLITEISYGYVKEVYYPCVGFWDRNLIWHEGKFNSQAWMVDSVVQSIEEEKE